MASESALCGCIQVPPVMGGGSQLVARGGDEAAVRGGGEKGKVAAVGEGRGCTRS